MDDNNDVLKEWGPEDDEAVAAERALYVWRDVEREAGAYTRPLLSSAAAVSDTRKYPTHPKHPQTPPSHGLHNPYPHPLFHSKRSN